MGSFPQSIVHYLPVTDHDERWGIVCTTAGYQNVPPGSPYPLTQHPDSYSFTRSRGRVLGEYQLLYIVSGQGEFRSASSPAAPVKAGTVVMLFPDEWHTYAPDPETGWEEWWVGFRGENIDRPRGGRLLFAEDAAAAYRPQRRHRELLSGDHPLGRGGAQRLPAARHGHRASPAGFGALQTRQPAIPRQPDRREDQPRPRNDAPPHRRQPPARRDRAAAQHRLHVVPPYVPRLRGHRPAQYQLQLRHNKARELLTTTDRTVSEIAAELGFENVSQFSAFFRQREKITATQYRSKYGF